MIFEELPDELLLEICRFLSSTDVLYSLFNLNSRLNRTISIYRQHAVLRRTSFIQFEYICLNILPKLGSTIRSLSINANWTDLLAKRFLFYFGYRMKEIFPNIEHLILVAFSGNELNDYIESISDLPYLNKLTIHDRYNVTEEYKQTLFNKILSANKNRLKKILFNRHSESLSINQLNSIIYPNIIELNIHLEKIDDLRYLFKLIPNICQMYIIIDKQLKDDIIQFDELIMYNLVKFHMESFRRCWIFDEISSLLKQMPFIKYLSLDIFSQDVRLFNGQLFLSILPINTLQCFNYAIDYTLEEEIENIDNIILSWSSTPYSICCLLNDDKSHMFLHTIPYGFSYLDISSLFIKYMNIKTNGYNYYIKELLIFNVSTLSEIFLVMNYCNKVKDLALEINDTSSSIITEHKQENKINLSLPCLNQLHWFSIDGCPSDGYLLKEILLVAPNLCMLILDMKFLLQLIDKENDHLCISLLKNRIKHLSIQITDETELNDNNIEILSNVFILIHHIIVENKTSNDISIENIILLFLHHFKTHKLVSIIFRSSTTEQLRYNPSQWLIEHTYLKEYTNKFKAECDELEFKIWL
ncbi:unnamed protein product [Rotaria sp. Silwood1]|nr:unnamed protein product [Rotaria sp. Silwood1]CAF0865598.1 unnamed protein product [Rotaria sp. Silwood1]CAF3386668.1 unnamed protein product [Rotaria sp. Silwood1]CAF4732880.1 unnamed protein product [Rotaria sp. Silwood1]